MAASGADKKQWVVVKFGGTSVSYGETWLQIVSRVKELQKAPDGTSYNVLLVLSALTQVFSPDELRVKSITTRACAGHESLRAVFKRSNQPTRAIFSCVD